MAITIAEVFRPVKNGTRAKVEGDVLVAFQSIPEDFVIALRVAPEAMLEYKGKVSASTRAERVA